MFSLFDMIYCVKKTERLIIYLIVVISIKLSLSRHYARMIIRNKYNVKTKNRNVQ